MMPNYRTLSNFSERANRISDRIINSYSGGQVSICDIGCRKCSLFNLIHEKKKDGFQFFGVDLESENLLECKKKNYQAVQLDLNTDPLPFEKAKFDFVVASEIIEHLHHPYQILGEIHRTLKDNGEFIITVPNIAALGKRVKLLLGGDPHAVYLPEEKDFHIREFTKGSLEKLLSFHGFRMESHEMLDLPAKNPVSKLIKKCFPSCKSHILYVAKKHYE